MEAVEVGHRGGARVPGHQGYRGEGARAPAAETLAAMGRGTAVETLAVGGNGGAQGRRQTGGSRRIGGGTARRR